MTWTNEPPTVPGWYWCRNYGDRPREIWEGVVRIDQTPNGLSVSWMMSPTEANRMLVCDTADYCQWSGPIPLPQEPPR